MLTKELLKKRSVWRYVFVMIIQLENDMGKKLMTFLKTNELIFFLKDWRKNVRSGSLTKGELQIKIDFKTCATLISFYLLKQEPLKKNVFPTIFSNFLSLHNVHNTIAVFYVYLTIWNHNFSWQGSMFLVEKFRNIGIELLSQTYISNSYIFAT